MRRCYSTINLTEGAKKTRFILCLCVFAMAHPFADGVDQKELFCILKFFDRDHSLLDLSFIQQLISKRSC